MKALTYIEHNHFALLEKPEPEIIDPRDAIVRVTLGSICTSDLHIKHGSVPRAVPGITVGHEMVGVVESVGAAVKTVRPGERVTVNVETFCGECYFCQHGWVNNCTGCPMPIRDSKRFPTASPMSRRCLWAIFSLPASGRQKFRRSKAKTLFSSSVRAPQAYARCCARH